MKIRGFIFDLDGVIVDTAKYHFLAWKALANSLNIDFTEAQNEELKGVSRIESLEKILSWGNKNISNEEFMKLMTDKNNEYLGYINEMTENEILPDVSRILNFLIENNQRIALGSASKNARIILEKVGLLEKFSAIVDGNNITLGKPNPEVFLNAANQIQVSPENCIVFEDAVAGIQAANQANMISIGIGDPKVLYEADYIFNNFTEIKTDFIISMLKNTPS